jgi:hypothetical protein
MCKSALIEKVKERGQWRCLIKRIEIRFIKSKIRNMFWHYISLVGYDVFSKLENYSCNGQQPFNFWTIMSDLNGQNKMAAINS